MRGSRPRGDTRRAPGNKGRRLGRGIGGLGSCPALFPCPAALSVRNFCLVSRLNHPTGVLVNNSFNISHLNLPSALLINNFLRVPNPNLPTALIVKDFSAIPHPKLPSTLTVINFPSIPSKFPLFQLKTLAPCPVTTLPEEEPPSRSLAAPVRHRRCPGGAAAGPEAAWGRTASKRAPGGFQELLR